mmetsp:Transcript_27307/g.81914  ORF Transcript_27307/g.81914 Transcript_27307/m.81914 type:complete len:252 (-) Transcript_27307:83-838(-)
MTLSDPGREPAAGSPFGSRASSRARAAWAASRASVFFASARMESGLGVASKASTSASAARSACLSGRSSLRASVCASASKAAAVKYIFSAGSATPREVTSFAAERSSQKRKTYGSRSCASTQAPSPTSTVRLPPTSVYEIGSTTLASRTSRFGRPMAAAVAPRNGSEASPGASQNSILHCEKKRAPLAAQSAGIDEPPSRPTLSATFQTGAVQAAGARAFTPCARTNHSARIGRGSAGTDVCRTDRLLYGI